MSDPVPTVFIVDDSREVRGALSRVLSIAGYSVRAFESAERFLEECDASAPGCLLLDLCLPGLSGLELQSELQKSNCAWPIVFLTGMGDIQIGVSAMKSGAVDFLTKPIDHVLLFAAVDRALRRDAFRHADSTRAASHGGGDSRSPQ
jgi:FixJ family two-component response regulator